MMSLPAERRCGAAVAAPVDYSQKLYALAERGGRVTTDTAPEPPSAPHRKAHGVRHAAGRGVPGASCIAGADRAAAEAFGHVVVKELLDNALDAAESAGSAPIIDIGTRTDDEVTFVTVSDNGAGITPAVVADLCDFNMLVSDKARYRGPARGAQGNALKTLLGIPFALGVAEPVIIESAGIRHELQVTSTGPAMSSSPTRRPPVTARWAHR